MKRWARRNLPTVVLLAALILLAALVLAIAMPRETENTPVVSAAISPTFDEAAYLKPDEQTKVVDVMKKEQIVPSMAQATALKEASRHADTMQKNLPSLAPAHKVDENKITSIIKPKKAPELKVTFTGAELKDFFPGEMPSVAEVKRVVFDALKIREEAYKRQAKRQAAKDAIKSPEH